MSSTIKKSLTVIVAVFLLFQLYQPARNVEYGSVTPMHISKVFSIPSEVEATLKTSCYDCHSNNTRYPWYSYVQPIRMYMDEHIKEGKENLNFSEFGVYSSRRQASKIGEIIEQIKEGEMPLKSYTIIHRNAELTEVSRKKLLDWLEQTKDSISFQN